MNFKSNEMKKFMQLTHIVSSFNVSSDLQHSKKCFGQYINQNQPTGTCSNLTIETLGE